jgi:hypothetical protein
MVEVSATSILNRKSEKRVMKKECEKRNKKSMKKVRESWRGCSTSVVHVVPVWMAYS